MALKTCLLVTDDPDDHQAIAEALSEISENTVLINILDSQKALLLLKESSYKPDFMVLDLSMNGIKVNSILKVLKNADGDISIPTIVYGAIETYLQIEEREQLEFFHKDYDYSELKSFLSRVVVNGG